MRKIVLVTLALLIGCTGQKDQTPPEIRTAYSINPIEVIVIYNEPIDPASAESTSNYLIHALDTAYADDTLLISEVFLVNDTSVKVITSPQTAFRWYVLHVKNVLDRAKNPISNTKVTFCGYGVAYWGEYKISVGTGNAPIITWSPDDKIYELTVTEYFCDGSDSVRWRITAKDTLGFSGPVTYKTIPEGTSQPEPTPPDTVLWLMPGHYYHIDITGIENAGDGHLRFIR
mgnify:CR=1 FL=1